MGSFFRRWKTRTEERIVALTVQKGTHELDLQSYLMGARPRRVFATAGRAVFGGDKPNDLTCGVCDEADTCPYGRGLCGPDRPRDFRPDGLCVYAREIDIEDHTAAVIDYDNGTRGSFVECFLTPEYKAEIRITGDEGQLDIYFKGGHAFIVRLGTLNSTLFEEKTFVGSGGHGGGDELLAHEVRRAVMEGGTIHPDLLDGYYAVGVAVAIHESAKTGMPVDIPAL